MDIACKKTSLSGVCFSFLSCTKQWHWPPEIQTRPGGLVWPSHPPWAAWGGDTVPGKTLWQSAPWADSVLLSHSLLLLAGWPSARRRPAPNESRDQNKVGAQSTLDPKMLADPYFCPADDLSVLFVFWLLKHLCAADGLHGFPIDGTYNSVRSGNKRNISDQRWKWLEEPNINRRDVVSASEKIKDNMKLYWFMEVNVTEIDYLRSRKGVELVKTGMSRSPSPFFLQRDTPERAAEGILSLIW